MTYNFDQVIERRDTGSLKWDRAPKLDPYWVADMDFTSPLEVQTALQERIKHGVFGYALPHRGLEQAVLHYLDSTHKVQVDIEEIVHLGGLVPALSLAVRAFAEPKDAVMTCTPIYPPFLGVQNDNNLNLITVNHETRNGTAEFNWEAMEEAVTDRTKVFLLCNPQNPLGRVFSKGEILHLAEFCERHDLVLVSDEIHADLIFDTHKTPHFSARSLPEEYQKRIITLLSPSKTYNIAGLGYSYAVISDRSLRRRFIQAKGHTLPEINCLAYYAAEAAYRHGEPWKKEMMSYLHGNYIALQEAIQTHLPHVEVVDMQGTYLMWLDFRALGIENPAKLFEERAGLFLSDGSYFGRAGCCRLNFGTTRARVMHAVQAMRNVF